MSYDTLKIRRAEALESINRQIQKGDALFTKGHLLIKEKGRHNIPSRDRDLFGSSFTLWVDLTYTTLNKVFESSKYAVEFKEKHSSKTEYVGSSWVPDIPYYLTKQLTPKLDYLKMLRDSMDDFTEKKTQSNLDRRGPTPNKTLENLVELKDIIDNAKGFRSKKEFLDWGSKIEPLLSFNPEYQQQFATDLNMIHANLSAQTAEPIANRMRTTLNKAIEQIKHDRIKILTEKQSNKEKEGVNQLATDRSKVFVVHGRNKKANVALFTFLRSIGLRPIEWSQAVKLTGKGSPYVGEVLDAAFEHAQAIVVLMTTDDIAFLKKDYREKNDRKHEIYPTPQPRPNVLFEAGMAMGRNPDRTILLELGTIRPFSDIGGRHIIKFDNSTEKRQEIAQRLENAKCLVDITGTDWHTAGDFTEVLNEITKADIKVYDDLTHEIVNVFKRMRSRGSVPTPKEIAKKLKINEQTVFEKMKDMFGAHLITYISAGRGPDLNSEYILGEKALEPPFSF